MTVEADLISTVVARLEAANLIPPINGVEAQEPVDDEWVLLTLHGVITDELTTRVRVALEGVRFELREVGAGHGISYRKP